jgi:hypothetical protein
MHRWVIGKTYAVQPGRGKKQIVRIRILNIRQEHLQDITEADAIAEGCMSLLCPVCGGSCFRIGAGMMEDPSNPHGEPLSFPIEVPCDYCEGHGILADACDVYEALWDNIHPKSAEQWEANPLVWVLEFEKVTESEREYSL